MVLKEFLHLAKVPERACSATVSNNELLLIIIIIKIIILLYKYIILIYNHLYVLYYNNSICSNIQISLPYLTKTMLSKKTAGIREQIIRKVEIYTDMIIINLQI